MKTPSEKFTIRKDQVIHSVPRIVKEAEFLGVLMRLVVEYDKVPGYNREIYRRNVYVGAFDSRGIPLDMPEGFQSMKLKRWCNPMLFDESGVYTDESDEELITKYWNSDWDHPVLTVSYKELKTFRYYTFELSRNAAKKICARFNTECPRCGYVKTLAYSSNYNPPQQQVFFQGYDVELSNKAGDLALDIYSCTPSFILWDASKKKLHLANSLFTKPHNKSYNKYGQEEKETEQAQV